MSKDLSADKPAQGEGVALSVYTSAVAGRRAFRELYRNAREALRVADEAINPPDRGGISMDEWNRRLKAATAKIREVTSAAPPSEKAEASAVEALRLAEVTLRKIARWHNEFPPTGQFWSDDPARPMSYSAAYGSNGERDYMRQQALNALETISKALAAPSEASAVEALPIWDGDNTDPHAFERAWGGDLGICVCGRLRDNPLHNIALSAPSREPALAQAVLEYFGDEPDSTLRPAALRLRDMARDRAEDAGDAERFRWWTRNYGIDYAGDGKRKLFTLVPDGYDMNTAEGFRAAIDDAIAQAGRTG